MTMSKVTAGIIKDSQELFSSYVDHAPITINGNADFQTQANGEGWDGDGTYADPYIIYGYRIVGSSNEDLIFIVKTLLSISINSKQSPPLFRNRHQLDK